MALRFPLAMLAVLALAAPAAALPLGLDQAAPAPAEPLVALVEEVVALAPVQPPETPPVVEETAAPVLPWLDAPPQDAATDAPAPPPAEEEDAQPPRRERAPRHDESPGFLGALPTLPPLPAPAVTGLVPRVDVLDLVPPPPPVLDGGAPAPAPVAPASAPHAAAPAPDAPTTALGVAALVGVAATAAAPTVGLAWDRLRRWGLLAVLYARIAKERLLDHGGRERLLEQVRLHPGLPLADLARAADIPRNTAVYHLRRLEKEGLLSSVRRGRVRLYFAPGSPALRADADALAALRHPTTRAVAAEVGSSPGLDQRALCARTGLTPSLAHWHASRLAEAGVVQRQREGRHVRYYPGPAMRLLG